MRAQLVRPAVVVAVTGFALVTCAAFSQAPAAESAAKPIAENACSSMPKDAVLLAAIAPSRAASTSPATSTSSDRDKGAATSAFPSASTKPSPSASPSSTSSGTSPTTSTSPSPSPSASSWQPTWSPSPSPSPSSSPTPAPAKAQLCVRVQSFSSSASVKPGHDAAFAVWVWTTKAASYGVIVRAHVAREMYIRAPSFTICPVTSGATCKLGNVPVGKADELQVRVPVGAKAARGERVRLTAQATASKATSFKGSATDVVVAALTATPTPSVPAETLSLAPVPGSAIAGSGVSASNPSGLFPTVGPASPGTGSLGRPAVKPRKDTRVAGASATVPVDDRLIGGQLAGLAVLAGAVVIAIARLSLRTAKAAEDRSDQPPR